MSNLKNVLSLQNLLLITILLVAFVLRYVNYWVIPLSGETADEMAWTWLGASLLQEGTPASWSYFDAYQEKYIYKEGIVKAPIVRPVLDHPPLFSFIPGLMQTLDSKLFDIPSRKVIRFPMLFIGVLNVFLLYVVSKKYFSTGWSLVAAGIYATVPLFVLSSRLVVSENLLITWYLLFVVLFLNWLKKPSKKIRNLLIILSVLAVMTKISGIVIPFALLAFGVLEKKRSAVQLGLFALGSAIGGLLLYASLYNLPLFLEVQFSQGGRELGLATLFYRFFIHPTVAQLVYFDGWLVIGFFSLLLLLFAKNIFLNSTEQKWKIIQILALSTIVFILFTSGQFTFHGWYSYPLFPLLIISIVYVLKKSLHTNSLVISMFWILFLPTVQFLLHENQVSLDVNLFRLVYLIGFMPVAMQLWGGKKAQLTSYVFLASLVILMNTLVIFTMTEANLQASEDQFFFNLQQ